MLWYSHRSHRITLQMIDFQAIVNKTHVLCTKNVELFDVFESEVRVCILTYGHSEVPWNTSGAA